MRYNKILYGFFLVLVCLFQAISLRAQLSSVEGYTLQQFTDENGLPQNSVNVIAPDNKGFIWLATEGGLVRFDGQQFFTYSSKSLGLNSFRMYHIVDGANDELLAINKEIELIRIKDGAATHFTGQFPFAAKALSQYPNLQEVVDIISFRQPKYHRRLYNDKHVLLVNDDESYYTSTNEYVQHYSKNKPIVRIQHFDSTYKTYFLLNKRLCCYLGNNEFALLDANNKFKKFVLKGLPIAESNSSSYPIIYSQPISHSAYYYFNDVLYKLGADEKGQLVYKELLRGVNFEEYSIISIYDDPETGNILLGSATEGLFYLKRKQFGVLETNRGKRHDVFYAHDYFQDQTVITPQGYILGEGIEKNWEVKSDSFSILERYSILRAKHGARSVWGKDDTLLYGMSPSGRLLHTWNLPDHINVLYENQQGVLWIGLRHEGVYKLDLNTINAKPEKVANIPNVVYFQQADDKNLWIGSEKGLVRLSFESDKTTLNVEVAQMSVRSLYVRKPNEVWGLAQDEGIFLFRDGQLIKFPLDRKEYLSYAHCMLEDKNGYFWISSNKGLFQVSKQNLLEHVDDSKKQIHYFYYGKESGFNTNEFNGSCQPCGVEWPDGKFSFPTLKGLVLFDPNKVKPEFPKKDIFIRQVVLDENEIVVDDTLRLPSDFERLTFYITTPFYGNANNLMLEASLQSRFGKPMWTGLGEDNSISFTSIPYGTYNLVIRAPRGFGADEYIYKRIVVVVPPAFWQTWWFAIVCVIIFFVVVYFATKYRLRYIIRQNLELEKMIADRTQDLRETVLALKKSESNLNSKSRLQQKIIMAFSHDLKSPMLYLMITGQKLQDNIQHVPAKMAESIKVMFSSSFKLYHFTDNFLNYAKIFFVKDLDMQKFSLRELVQEKIEILEFIAQSKNIKIQNNVSADTTVLINRMSLSIIIHNLLDNAIKYTDEGLVKLYTHTDANYVHLHIADTGMGMNELVKRRYVEYFKKEMNEQLSNEDSGQGLGLQIVKELVHLNGARVVIHSIEGDGTDVIVSIKRG